MSISVDFAPTIASYARAHHLDLSKEAADSLAQTLTAVMKVDGGLVAFTIGNGRTGDITAALDLFTEGMPRKTATSLAEPVGNSATARAVAQNYARTPQARAAVIVSDHGNPWHPQTISRTRQAALVNLDPTLAARLQKEAA